MKKFLIISSVFILLTLTALIIAPILFEDDIKVRFINIINKELKAKANFNDLVDMRALQHTVRSRPQLSWVAHAMATPADTALAEDRSEAFPFMRALFRVFVGRHIR